MLTRKPFCLGHDAVGKPVYLPEGVRKTSMQIVGAPGTGKTKFIENLIQQDICNGEGLCLIDPHGHLFDRMIEWCASSRVADWRKILVIDPASRSLAPAFNPLDVGRYEGQGDGLTRDFCISSVISSIAQAWREYDPARTPRLRRILYTVLAPLVRDRLTLLEAYELLGTGTDSERAREHVARSFNDDDERIMQLEWKSRIELTERQFIEMTDSTLSRLFEALKAPVLQNIFGQTNRNIDFLRLMNERWIVLINLATGGVLAEDNARLLGALLVNDMFLAARCRDEETGRTVPFHLYIDECSEFLNKDVARVLTEGRKFGLHLTLAHQDLGQLREEGERIYKAVMGSARTKVVFAVEEEEDAETMAKRIFRGAIDLEEAKHTLDKPAVVGHQQRRFEGGSESEGYAEGESLGDVLGTSSGRTKPVDGDDDEGTENAGESRSASSSSSWSSTRSSTRSWTTSLTPEMAILPTSVYSLEEQRYRKTVLVGEQLQRQALVKMPGRTAIAITVPAVADGYASKEECEAFKLTHGLAGGFAAPIKQVLEETRDRREQFLELTRNPPPRRVPALRPEDDELG